MKWHRNVRILGLTLLLLFGVSCSPSDITGASEAQPAQPLLGDLADGLGDTIEGTVDGLGNTLDGTVAAIFEITDLLTCTEQDYVAVTETIGPQGGQIKVGDHLLQIPEGALSSWVRITAEQMPGSTNSVRFSPEGLQFERSAALTMSYRNCAVVLLPKSIVYTTEKFKILEVLRSLDLFRKRTISAPIDHFSRYAVAY